MHFLPLEYKGITGMEPKWLDGVWLGMLWHSTEVIAGTRSGVFKTRSIRR